MSAHFWTFFGAQCFVNVVLAALITGLRARLDKLEGPKP